MPPEGILIGPASRQWRVGKMLGSGACGSVHDITAAIEAGDSGRSSKSRLEYVVKIAPIPADGSSASRRKKKKKTPLERNADLLHYENNLYRNVLNDLRGVYIPEVPLSGDGGPPGYGDTDGYRFLCMEKMAAPLASIVPILLEELSRRKAVPFGDVACALVDIVEAIHDQNLIFVDVKPENFMISQPTSKRVQTCKDVCRRLRMIDFGLVENFRNVTAGGHREDSFPDAQFVGTPVYASINVLEGHTASRRDDLEALGYVMLELLLMLIDERLAATSSSSPLPWGSGESDEEILTAKKKAIEGSGSKEFFAQIGSNGNKGAQNAMKRFFEAVRKIAYAEKPSYDDLKDILCDISVKVNCNVDEKKPAAAKGHHTSRDGQSRSSRRTRSRAVDEDVHEQKAPVVAAKKRESNRAQATEAVEVHEIDSPDDSDMEDYHSCCSEVKDMDWESLPNENTPPSREGNLDEKSSVSANDVSMQCYTKPEKRAGKGKGHIEVIFVSGPHEGESFSLGGECPEVVTVGKAPSKSRSKSRGSYKIHNDGKASASHVKLALHSAKGGVFSVRVTDLNADVGTKVNGKAVTKGKYKQAFIGSKIQIGESVLQLKKEG